MNDLKTFIALALQKFAAIPTASIKMVKQQQNRTEFRCIAHINTELRCDCVCVCVCVCVQRNCLRFIIGLMCEEQGCARCHEPAPEHLAHLCATAAALPAICALPRALAQRPGAGHHVGQD